MKKIISVILSITLLLAVTACEGDIQESTAGNRTTENHNETSAETTAKTEAPLFDSQEIYYHGGVVFADTPTRVLYTYGSKIYYYNKLTEEIGIFCFDPLCGHGGIDCISNKFYVAFTGFTIQYAAFDNRFYVLRGDKFISFAFDGSDLTLVHSFGEIGNFEDLIQQYLYVNGSLYAMRIWEKNVCFFRIDEKTGKRNLMRYDIQTGDLKVLFADAETSISDYMLTDEGIYMHLVGSYAGLYRIQYDGTGLTQLSETFTGYFNIGIFDGEWLYYEKRNAAEEGQTRSEKIVAFSPKTGEIVDIMETQGMSHSLLAVTKQYIYYSIFDPISIGHDSSQLAKERFNTYSKIYRFDRESGETVIVLDDLRCETYDLCFADEDTVLLFGNHCVPHEADAWKNGGGFMAKLDEDGMFTALTQLP